MNTKRNYWLISSILLVTFLGNYTLGFAQLKGDHLLGDYGLAAGTQAPPSIIVALPVYGDITHPVLLIAKVVKRMHLILVHTC